MWMQGRRKSTEPDIRKRHVYGALSSLCFLQFPRFEPVRAIWRQVLR